MNDLTAVRIHFTLDPVTFKANVNEYIKGRLLDVEKCNISERGGYLSLICWQKDSYRESR